MRAKNGEIDEMIDIHSHILPGMDDGAQDLYDTLEMVDLAARSGIKAIIATPHCNIPRGYTNYFGEEYKACVQAVRDAVRAEGIPVRILPGAEALGTPDLPELLQEGKIMTLNQSRYLLVEFLFDEDPEFVNRLLEELKELKAIPVIAHPERYKFVQRDPNLVYEWRTKGYPVQVNKGSFRGKFGTRAQETAYLLMDHNMVSVIASDAHSPKFRTPSMTRSYRELAESYPEKYLELLFKENPRRLCQNEPLLALKAMRVE